MKPADEEQELTRLLAQEPSPLASSLAALQNNGPDATELASLASRLALQGLDVSASRPPSRANSWKKWVMGGLGGASVVVAWLALRGAPPAAQGALSAPTMPPASARATVVVGPAGVPPHAALGDARRDALAVADAVPAPASAAATPTPTVPTPALEGPKSTPAPGAAPAERHDSASSLSNPIVASPRTPVSAAAGAAGVAPSPTGSALPATELELLRDARLALRQSPARALQLTDEHARQYPQGKLTQERELIAVSALVALGRRTAALGRAASFERLYPTSPYRKQMGDLLR